jgi:ATP-dependent helicase/nuclease subunit A
MDSEGARIRVMTVHGAKGLEAPVVILPDTTDRKPRDHQEIYRLPEGAPVWKTGAEDSPPAIAASREARKRDSENESLRLLYVALTRARCWLIVAGAGEAKLDRGPSTKPVPKEPAEWCWYRHIEAGMKAIGAAPRPGGGLFLSFGDWPAPIGPGIAPETKTHTTLPLWALRPAPDVASPPKPLSPSALGGAKAIWSGAATPEDPLAEEAAKARGTALHALLEHLSAAPDPEALAARLIPEPASRAALLAEAQAILGDPALAALFAPGTLAEVAISAQLGSRTLFGSIDRLIVTPDHVLAVDFKSNATVPATAAATPEGILRQMGAYAEALSQIYPGRRIETAILWTATRQLMPLDPEIVRQALQRAAIA